MSSLLQGTMHHIQPLTRSHESYRVLANMYSPSPDSTYRSTMILPPSSSSVANINASQDHADHVGQSLRQNSMEGTQAKQSNQPICVSFKHPCNIAPRVDTNTHTSPAPKQHLALHHYLILPSTLPLPREPSVPSGEDPLSLIPLDFLVPLTKSRETSTTNFKPYRRAAQKPVTRL